MARTALAGSAPDGASSPANGPDDADGGSDRGWREPSQGDGAGSLGGGQPRSRRRGAHRIHDARHPIQFSTGIAKVDLLVAEISAATNVQSGGIAQVSDAVGRLDEMTQQNASLVEQTAAASESLKQQASRLGESLLAFKL